MSENALTGSIPLRPLPVDLEATIDHVHSQGSATDALVRQAVGRGLSSLLFLGCGGSLTASVPARYALERHTRVPVLAHNSDEFLHRRPALVDGATLAVAVSHTGRTPETLAAADAARAAGAAVIGICRLPDAPLADHVDLLLTYRSPDVVTAAEHLLLARVVVGVMSAAAASPESAALAARLPAVLESMAATYRAALEQREAWAARVASAWAAASPVTVLGAGPNLGAAQALAQYYFQEMQWMDAAGLHAGDFLHGPFEVVGPDSAVLVLLGEDATRPVAERAARFLARYAPRHELLDTRDLELPSVPRNLRPEVTPFLLDALTVRLAEHFEHTRGHSLDERRYMAKVEY
jgi:fructoselysine-6-P-deglycase FrlB-like protein